MFCGDTSINYKRNYSSICFAGRTTFYTSSNTLPARVVLHWHHPDDKQEEENGGKLAHLPDSMKDLLMLAGERHHDLVF